MKTTIKTGGENIGVQSEAILSPVLRPVGIIKNEIKEPFLAAGEDGLDMQKSIDKVHDEIRRLDRSISTIIVNDDLVDSLQGIEEYSHLLVLYWAHKLSEPSRSLKRVHPMGRKEIPTVGLFCTCSPARPNPVLICVVQLRERKENILKVSGLDAINGSPVIDIKPYVNQWYPQEGISIPEWMRQLMGEIDQNSG